MTRLSIIGTNSSKPRVDYLPGIELDAFVNAFEIAGTTAPDRLDAVFAFLSRLPVRAQNRVLLQGLRLAAIAERDGMTHLHAHFMTGAAQTAHVAHLISGVPFSVTTHAKDLYRYTVDASLFEEIASAASFLITVCDANRQYLIDRDLVPDSTRIEVVYNGIPFAEYDDHSHVVSRDQGLILAVGRLVEKKGFATLIDAMPLLTVSPKAQLVIVGDGDERRRRSSHRSNVWGSPIGFGSSVPKPTNRCWIGCAGPRSSPRRAWSARTEIRMPFQRSYWRQWRWVFPWWLRPSAEFPRW